MIILDIMLTIVGVFGAIIYKSASRSYWGFSNEYDTYFWIYLLMAGWGIVSLIFYYIKKLEHNAEVQASNASRTPTNMRVCPHCGMKNISSGCTTCPKCGKEIE